MWSSLIHLDLSFVQGDKNGSIRILLHDNCQLCQHHLLKMLSFFPLDDFSSHIKDQVTISVWVHFWVFNSIPFVYLSVTIPVPCSFFHNCSVVQKLERAHTSSLTIHLKALEQKEANSSKRSRWQGIIKLRGEIKQVKTRRTIQRINQTRSWFFEKINKIDKPLARLKKRAQGKHPN